MDRWSLQVLEGNTRILKLGRVPRTNGSMNSTNKRHTRQTLCTYQVACHHAELRTVVYTMILACRVYCMLGLPTCNVVFVLLSVFNAEKFGNGCSYSCTANFHACIHRLDNTETSDGCQPFNSRGPKTAYGTRQRWKPAKSKRALVHAPISYPVPWYTIRCQYIISRVFSVVRNT